MIGMFDHPVTQKILLPLVTAGVLAWGGLSYKVAQKVDRHELQILQLEEMQEDVKLIARDTADIKTDVRVLEERTRTYQDGTPRKAVPPKSGP